MSQFLYKGAAPSEDDIIQALSKAFDAPESAAIAWLSVIHIRFDPKAAAERLAARSEYTMLGGVGGSAV